MGLLFEMCLQRFYVLSRETMRFFEWVVCLRDGAYSSKYGFYSFAGESLKQYRNIARQYAYFHKLFRVSL